MTKKKDQQGRPAQHLGTRAQEVRLSLDPGNGKEFPRALMDRVAFRTDSRHRWQTLEKGKLQWRDELPDGGDPAMAALVRLGMQNLAEALDVADPAKTAQKLVDYILHGKSSIPWSSPPGWKTNPPIRKAGRPVGSRVVGDMTVVPPDGALPQKFTQDPTLLARQIPTAVGSPAPVSAPAATLVPITGGEVNEAALNTILEQVKLGKMDVDAARTVIKVLVASGGGGGMAGGLAAGGRPQTAHKPANLKDLEAFRSATDSCGNPRRVSFVARSDQRSADQVAVAQRPLPRELVAEIFGVLPRLNEVARSIVQDCLGYRQAVRPAKKA